jgi:ATP-dependent Lhr-like helicase
VFARLHPTLRHAIVHDLGWRTLRAVQEATIEAVLDGCNTVVLAPTAGGKTEASIFPVLSRILAEELAPVAALYVCPIRALLNNQEERIGGYARMVGLESFKWHGDVSASRKQRFVREPKHVLMITPESLEVMLVGQKNDARRLFAGLSVVVVDEVHAFAADDRGAHLVSLLERLAHFCGRDLQRIGLSATVGNPEEIGRWLQGSSKRPFRLVDPPRPALARDLAIELFEDAGGVAKAAAQLGRGRKSLVFVETRGEAERIAGAMQGLGVDVFVHHSAVSRADRQAAEERFVVGRNTAIVCTSTMELGIDVGDLDLVLQVDAPSTVASLLQRMGRTGRRSGTRPNATFLCKSAESMLQATAMLRLAERGWVESVRPVRAAAHVLAHQIMALTLQEGGVSRHDVLGWIATAAPYEGLTPAAVQLLIDTMVAREILHEADGLLSLGLAGERKYGRQNFFELYAVFSTPTVLRVEHGSIEVGTIHANFAQATATKGDGPFVFRLAGRSWQVVQVEWQRGVCRVVPADGGKVPVWMGIPLALSFAACQEMKATLAAEDFPAWLRGNAAAELKRLREGYAGLVEAGATAIEVEEDGVVWHTFGGGAANRLLAAGLERVRGEKWTAGNLSLRRRCISLAAASASLDAIAAVDWPGLALASADRPDLPEVSKFQDCLPDVLDRRLVAGRLYAPETAGEIATSRRIAAHG